MSTDEKIKKQLVFAGCGGMYHYILGIASVIQKNFVLGPEIIISCSSAGCFPALLLILDMDIDKMFESWNVPFLQEVYSLRLGALFHWNNIVRKWTLPKLDDTAFERANSRLYCSLTSFPDFNNHIITDWKSNQDLVDGIMASGFIPLFDICKLTATFRNRRFLDGSITNSSPVPFNNIKSFTIKYNMWRQIETNWLWIWSDINWARKLYELGKEDAMKHIDELSEFFNQ